MITFSLNSTKTIFTTIFDKNIVNTITVQLGNDHKNHPFFADNI